MSQAAKPRGARGTQAAVASPSVRRLLGASSKPAAADSEAKPKARPKPKTKTKGKGADASGSLEVRTATMQLGMACDERTLVEWAAGRAKEVEWAAPVCDLGPSWGDGSAIVAVVHSCCVT